MLEQRCSRKRKEQQLRVKESQEILGNLTFALEELQYNSDEVDDNARKQMTQVSALLGIVGEQLAEIANEDDSASAEQDMKLSRLTAIPPAMVSELADRKLVSDKFLDEATSPDARVTRRRQS